MHADISDSDLRKLLGIGIGAGLSAGDAIMRVYNSAFEVNLKSDQSPVTEADLQSHEILMAQLSKEIPILSEEGSQAVYEERRDWNLFWLIDPLDGTKEFIKRSGEFTVNVALIKGHSPIAGIVYLPAQEILYFGGRGFGSYQISGAALDEIRGSDDVVHSALASAVLLPDPHKSQSFGKIRLVQSLSHITREEEDFTARLKAEFEDLEIASAGSSLKFCLVSAGGADLYPRFGPTMEWDTAAGQCIAESSGCEVVDLETLSPLRYNKRVLQNGGFLVMGSRFRMETSWRKSALKFAQASRNASA